MISTNYAIYYVQLCTERLEPRGLGYMWNIKKLKSNKEECRFNDMGHEVMLVNVLKTCNYKRNRFWKPNIALWM